MEQLLALTVISAVASIVIGLGLALGAILGCLLLATCMWLLGSGYRMHLGFVLTVSQQLLFMLRCYFLITGQRTEASLVTVPPATCLHT